MTHAEAEAKARDLFLQCEIYWQGQTMMTAEETRGIIAAALLAAAAEGRMQRCQGCLSSDYCPEHDIHNCYGRCKTVCGCTHYEGDDCAAIRARGEK